MGLVHKGWRVCLFCDGRIQRKEDHVHLGDGYELHVYCVQAFNMRIK